MASKSQKQQKIDLESIAESYMDFVLTEGKEPSSVYSFSKQLGCNESEFYKYFNSFSDINSHIWKAVSESSIQALVNSAEYGTYTSREKVLGLFYTLIEQMNKKRSYFLYSLKNSTLPMKAAESMKPDIMSFSKEVIQSGLAEKELEDRKFLSERYHEAVWINFLFVVGFWMKDDSKAFEKTDAMIEKTVNLMMELMGKSALDGMLDLGKFLLQNRFKPDFKF